MKAILLDPEKKCISVQKIEPSAGELRRLCGAVPRVLATLPSGDVLLGGQGTPCDPGFSIGGSKVIRSLAVVLGKRDAFGERTGARSSAELLRGLVRWADPESIQGQRGGTMKVILIDPEAGVIDHIDVGRTMAAIEVLVGGEAVPLMTVPGDDVVYGKSYARSWRWRKDDCVFNGRCVIAGSDRMNRLTEPVSSVEALRRTVEFGPPGRTVWIGWGKHGAANKA